MKATPLERFMAKVEKTDTCWLWTGETSKPGYGRIRVAGKPWHAHRYAFTYANGPIPDGMIVCHPNPPDDSFQDNPVVIAEVISEATRRIDEGEKRDAYLTIPSLTTYLLIETDLPRVVVHRRTETVFVPEIYEGADPTIPLGDVACSIALAELYEPVEFAAPQG